MRGGDSINDRAILVNMGIGFFKNLLSQDQNNDQYVIRRGAYPRLNDDEIANLNEMVQDEEIKLAIFSLGSWKAPSPDGLRAMFYQANWDCVKESLSNWVKSVFQNPYLVKQVNSTFISLTLKLDRPESISQFRPIGLCNVSYKLIIKIIASRSNAVMPKIISQK